MRDEGFRIFKSGLVRRISPKHFVVKASSTDRWNLIELRDGNWICDCGVEDTNCAHLYATQLHRSTSKLKPDLDEDRLKCRYCGSMDVAKCGFRYNSRGIARRYYCQDCQRKFSVPYVEQQGTRHVPSDALWLLGQVAMLTSKLNDLIESLNERISSTGQQSPSPPCTQVNENS